MKTRTIAFSIRALALGALLAASPLSFAAETSGSKSTAKDIAKKADETGQAIKNYTVAQRDEAIKNAKAALDDADRRIDTSGQQSMADPRLATAIAAAAASGSANSGIQRGQPEGRK